MEGVLWAVTGIMVAAAAMTAAPVAWDYFIEPGPACPGQADCLTFELGGQAYAVAFDPAPFEAQDTPALLAGMLSASAAILAVSFALNQVVLSNISQRYSARLVESSAGKPTGIFVSFVIMVAGSAALLLAHNSLPAWLAACAVLVLTVGLFASLWLFARGFIHMMLVISPHNFIKDAEQKIIKEIDGSKGKSARARSRREKQSRGLIQSLGDAAVKSMATKDADVCMACIDALYGVGKEFLDRKRDSPDEYAVVDDPREDPSRNMHASYVAAAFVRIIKDAAATKNSPITDHAMERFFLMVGVAMRDESCKDVIPALYDTDRVKGSPCLQLVELMADEGGKYDKIRMIRHLADLPSAAVLHGGHMPLVEQFVTRHLFRAVVMIIDRGDFDLFKEVLRLFSRHPFFANMEAAPGLIKSEVSSSGLDAGSLRDKILFELDNGAKKDFDSILALKKEVEDSIRTRPDAKTQSAAETNVAKYLDRLYAYSLLWGTFFRIACYIIGKGDGHAGYLRELWHHTSPDGQPHQSTNTPPCSMDVDWNSLYPRWRGRKHPRGFGLIEGPDSYEPHYYEYAALHMLREGRIWRAPTDGDIDGWGERGNVHALEYHLETIRSMDAERFLGALDSLDASGLPAELMPGLDVRARIASVRWQIESFRSGRQSMEDKLAAHLPLDGDKIKEWTDKARRAYSESTEAGRVARIKYDADLGDAAPVFVADSESRRVLVKGDAEIDGHEGRWTAALEFAEIMSKARNYASPVEADLENPLASIKACVQRMRDGGYKPRAVFISQGDIFRIMDADECALSEGVINVDGSPVSIVGIPANNLGVVPEHRLGGTMIIDPDCIEVAYKAEDEAGRLQLVRVPNAEPGATPAHAVLMSVRILDGRGIAQLVYGGA